MHKYRQTALELPVIDRAVKLGKLEDLAGYALAGVMAGVLTAVLLKYLP